jgi:hypothetical protein
MPNCFTLTRKGENVPTAFVAIDAELCQHFKVPVHETQWYNGWYDYIGLGLACGKPLAELALKCEKHVEEGGEHKDFWQRMLQIARWLDDNYTSDSWYQGKS